MKGVKAFGRTDIGRKRSGNQDSIVLNDKIGLYAIADGMGGHKGGEIASALAVEVLESALSKIDEKKHIQIVPFLKEAISLASIRIHERASMDDSLKGMGTTLVCVFFYGAKCYIAQVGDSRVYLHREGDLWKITEDHSLVNEQVRSGLITRSQADKLAYKNVITRSVGFEEIVEVDVYVRELQSGDLFLLCSDGLTSMINDDEIKSNIDPDDIKKSVNDLIDAANNAGGYDNVSVIIARVD
ncbi:MAG: Stp1/IreP family PP2C-type Ser/Thr phosphatase [bacterium]